MRFHLPATAIAVALALVAGCGGDDEVGVRYEEYGRVPAEQATGLAVDVDGTLLVGERLTGRVFEVDPATGEATERTTVGPLDVRPTQRGLLALAVTPAGRAIVSFTDPDGSLVVAPLDRPDEAIWIGPDSTDQATGGRIVALDDGTVVVGIGDLLDPPAVDDPGTPNGKLLRLDAATDAETDGSAEPAVLAGGFNNPFALATDGTTVWVADNAPGSRPERIVRVDPDGTATELGAWDDTRVPSGLAVVPDGTLALCTYATSELRLVDPDDAAEPGALVGDGCRYGVVAFDDGRLAYATEDEVVLLRPAR